MVDATSSPQINSAPTAHNQPYRSSPRHQANTHSPRLRSKKSYTSPLQSNISSSISTLASAQQQPAASAKADHGTQYSPPDWPPTSSRSSLRRIPHTQLPIPTPQPSETASAPSQTVPQPTIQQFTYNTVAPSAPSSIPPEPEPRVTPPAPPQDAPVVSTRRPRAVDSSSSTRNPSPNQSPSQAKRPRSSNTNKKMMPADYAECDPKALASLIADMLMELIRFNDDIPLANNQLTRFHSRAPPGISVHDYLIRLTHHATLIPPILLSMVYYIDKLCLLYPAFTINSLTVHRFLITAATVASKGLSDSFWTNNTYARVGGVTIKELALLELEFLTRVQWRIVPKPEALVDYYRNLIERSEEWVIEGDEQDSDMDDRMSDDSGDKSSEELNRNQAEAMDTSEAGLDRG